jgi:hypothetical protein
LIGNCLRNCAIISDCRESISDIAGCLAVSGQFERSGDLRWNRALRNPTVFSAPRESCFLARPAFVAADAEITSTHARDVGAAVRAALADPRSLGGKILILDETAGFLPFGLAEVLANGGAEVEVVTPNMFAAEDVFGRSMPRAQFWSKPLPANEFSARSRRAEGRGARHLLSQHEATQ